MQVSAPPPRSGDIAIPYLEGNGPIYTSAGITAGIDLSLALVEEDHGQDTALKSARFLVMSFVRTSAILPHALASGRHLAAKKEKLSHPCRSRAIRVRTKADPVRRR
jgi:hypothetical protein